jgi:hypothetical protein
LRKELERRMGKEEDAQTVSAQFRRHVGGQAAEMWIHYWGNRKFNCGGPGPSTRHKLLQEKITERRNRK